MASRAATRPTAPTRSVRATDHAEVPPPPSRISLTGRAAILAVVIAVLMISFAYPLRNWFDQRGDLAVLREQIAKDRASVAELERSITRWDDAEYVRAQARDRLRYVLPGEVGYVVIGDDFVEPDADQPVEPAAWWQRLWGSVEAADAGEPATAPGSVAPGTDPLPTQSAPGAGAPPSSNPVETSEGTSPLDD